MVKVLNILLLFFSSLPLLAGMIVKDIVKCHQTRENVLYQENWFLTTINQLILPQCL